MSVFQPFMNGYMNVGNEVWEHLRSRTFSHLEAAELEKAAMLSPADVEARGQRIREAFLASIGGLPPLDGPLNLRQCGEIAEDALKIEKLAFDSSPGAVVTANLYRPLDDAEPRPAILFLCGHSPNGKAYPYYQRACREFARAGFAVLIIDPTGQGERVTDYDPETGDYFITGTTAEHSYRGQQCALNGHNIARYLLADALRALDVLEQLPGIDADSIGVTGNSGGGTQTTFLTMHGEPRIKCASPCTYVTSREHYLLAGGPQDAEQIQFAMTRNGINFDDMFLPFAPRPLLIGAVASDFFPLEGTQLTYERTSRAYSLFGAEHVAALAVGPGRHCYSRELRSATISWHRRWLMDKTDEFVSLPDEDLVLRDDEDLWCTANNHVPTYFQGARTVYDLNIEEIPRRKPARDKTALGAAVVSALNMGERLKLRADALYPRWFQESRSGRLLVEQTFFESEPGIHVAGVLYTDAALVEEGRRPKEACVLLQPGGTNASQEAQAWIDEAVDGGQAAFLFDPRGTGGVSPHPINVDHYNPEQPADFGGACYNTPNWLPVLAFMLGDHMLGMRVYDVLRAARLLREELGAQRIEVRASGIEPCLWAYLAGALDDLFACVRVEELLPSWEAVVRERHYRDDFLTPCCPHGVLEHFDLPELRPLFEGRELEAIEAEVRSARAPQAKPAPASTH